jgi:hypothetical protein
MENCLPIFPLLGNIQFVCTPSLPPATKGTVGELRLQRSTTTAACTRLRRILVHRIPLGYLLVASPAKKKRVPPLDRKQWNEKQTQIVICLLCISLIQTASRTAPGRGFKGAGFGLDACDHKKHCLDPVAFSLN